MTFKGLVTDWGGLGAYRGQVAGFISWKNWRGQETELKRELGGIATELFSE